MQPAATAAQAPSSPPPLDRRGQRAARLWPLLNGGEAGQVGHRSHRAALPTPQHLLCPPIWSMQQLDTYLPATYPSCPARSNQSSAVPYSAFPSERAARLALLAHRPRGFSPPSLSLFYRCRPLQSAPALPNPRPQFACPPQPTHNHNHKAQPAFTPASSFPPLACQHRIVPWCSINLQPGSKPCNSPPNCRPRTSTSLAQNIPTQLEMDPPNKRRRLAPKVPEPAPIPTATATAAAAATVPTPATTPQQAQYSPEQVSPWINLFASTPNTRLFPG